MGRSKGRAASLGIRKASHRAQLHSITVLDEPVCSNFDVIQKAVAPTPGAVTAGSVC